MYYTEPDFMLCMVSYILMSSERGPELGTFYFARRAAAPAAAQVQSRSTNSVLAKTYRSFQK